MIVGLSAMFKILYHKGKPISTNDLAMTKVAGLIQRQTGASASYGPMPCI